MNSIKLLLTCALSLVLFPCHAETRDYGEGIENLAPAITLNNHGGLRDHWQGIGRLSTDTSCTATQLDTKERTGVQRPPAYVLTAGHCVDLSSSKIITNQPLNGKIHFNYFDEPEKHKTYDLKKVKWRSMQGVDMAIIELDVSLQTLIEQGVRPLKLATEAPSSDSEVLMVGAPTYETLRLSACYFNPAAEIVEHNWVWRNNFVTRCQGVRGGVSGSPLLDRYTNKIVGVINTSNRITSLTPCELHAPCLLTKAAYKEIPGNVYGNRTDHLRLCFRSGFLFENHCELYPTFNIESDEETFATYRKIKKSADGSLIGPTWNYRFSIDTSHYRYKTVRNAKSCEKPGQYSDAISSTDAFINHRISLRAGRHFLCIIGTNSIKQEIKPGLLRNALSISVVLIKDRPVPKPELKLLHNLFLGMESPKGYLLSYSYKMGPTATTDCQNPEGYSLRFRTIHLPERKQNMLPLTICSIAYDAVGDRSEVSIERLDKL